MSPAKRLRLPKALALSLWAVHPSETDGYTAPERCTAFLSGICPERETSSRDPAKDRLRTSPVEKFNARWRIATTRSGTRYRLVGRPLPAYAKWCRQHNYGGCALLRTMPPKAAR